MASNILDIPVLDEPVDPSQVIGEAMKTTSEILKKGFKDVKGLYGLISDSAKSGKEVKQEALFTKESLKFYQDMNKGKLPKAKKTEIKALTEIAKQEMDAMLSFGDSIGESLSQPLLPKLSEIANGFFDVRDGFKKDMADISKTLKEGAIGLIPQGLKDMLGIIRERSDKDDKNNKKEDKHDKKESAFWKNSLSLAGKMLKSMGNWIFDLILFFIALAIFDPNGTFLMSIMSMLFNIGMMLLNMVINMIPKIIAMIPPLITKLVNAFVTAMPLIIDALMKLFIGMGDIIVTLVDALAEQLPILIPVILDAIFKIAPKILDLIVKILPKLLMLIVDNIGVIINALVEALPTLIDAIIDALPIIIIAFIDAFIKLIPILSNALIKIVGTLISRVPKLFGALFKIFKNYFIDPFKKMFIAMFDKIASFIRDSAIGKAFDKIGQLFKDLKDIGGKIANALNLSGVADKILGMFSELWDWLADRWPFSLFKSNDNYKSDEVNEVFASDSDADKAFQGLIAGKVQEGTKLDEKFDKLAEELQKSGKLKTDTNQDGKIDSKDLAFMLKNGNKDVVDAIKRLKVNMPTSLFTAQDLNTLK